MLGQYQRRPVTAFQSQPVPDDEGVGLGGQRDELEDQFAGGTFDPLASNHAAQFLPRGKAVADRDDCILTVVAQKQLVLRGLDRRQDRGRIGGHLPLLSNVREQIGSQTRIWQNCGITAQIVQCLPQIRSCHMRQLERDTVETGRVSVGDAARDQQLAINRTRPGNRHGSLRSRMHKESSCGQHCPELQILGTRVHKDRGFRTEAPRLQFRPPSIIVPPFGEERWSCRRFQEAPAGLVLVRPGVPLE